MWVIHPQGVNCVLLCLKVVPSKPDIMSDWQFRANNMFVSDAWYRRLNRSRIVQSDPRAFYRSIPLHPVVPGCACKIAETCVRVYFNGSQTSIACSAENSSRGKSKKARRLRRKLDPWQVNFFSVLTLRLKIAKYWQNTTGILPNARLSKERVLKKLLSAN